MLTAICGALTGMRAPSSSRASSGVRSTPAAVESAVSTMDSGACSGCERKVAYEASWAPLTQLTCSQPTVGSGSCSVTASHKRGPSLTLRSPS